MDRIEAARFPIVFFPFHGSLIPCEVRTLTHAQTLACGQFSLIETLQDTIYKKKLERKPNMSQLGAYAERQIEIVKRALVKPTYDQIIERLTDSSILETKKKLSELEEKTATLEPGPRKTAFESEIEALRIWCDFLLPEDFTAAVMSYALKIDQSDIKELSEEILLDAAILATKGNDNPHDHIHGIFTDFMLDDIDRRAWIIYQDHIEKQKAGGDPHVC